MSESKDGSVELVKEWDVDDFNPGTVGREGVCTWGDDRGEAVATVFTRDRNGKRSAWAACEVHRQSITTSD